MKLSIEHSRELRKQFIKDVSDPKHNLPAEQQTETSGTMNCRVLVTATLLPSGALEVAQNAEDIEQKIMDILSRYDENFELIPSKKARIVGYMLL